MIGWLNTYINNKKVQPAPGVGEVLDKPVGHPLQQHLQDEDVGEHPVRVLQNDPDGLPLLDVHVLEGLGRGEAGVRRLGAHVRSRLMIYISTE